MFVLFFYLCKYIESIDIFGNDVSIKRSEKQHNSKVHFRVVSKYKRFFQLRNRFFSSDLRILLLRSSKKWRFMDKFFFKQTHERSFKFFSYKLALMLKQLLKHMFLCNELTFKRGLINRIQNFSNRLDLVCIRVHFFVTLREARVGITKGLVLVNNVTISYWNFYLKLFDLVRLVNTSKIFYPFIRWRSRLKFYWRVPLLFKVLLFIFRLLNQLRFWICSFFSLFNLVFLFKNFCFLPFLKIVFSSLCSFSLLFVLWRSCICKIPRSLVNGIYFARPYFKRKIRMFINNTKLERRAKLIAWQRKSVWRFRKMIYRHKRVDIRMRVWRYVKYISIFTLFWFFSYIFCAFTYRRIRFTVLKNHNFLFFPRLYLYVFVYIRHYVILFHFFMHFLYWGGLFLFLKMYPLSAILMKSYVFSSFYYKPFVYIRRSFKRKVVTVLQGFSLIKYVDFLFMFYAVFSFSFCLLFVFMLYMFLYKTVLNIYFSFRLYRKATKNVNSVFSLRGFKQVCFIKKRVSTFGLFYVPECLLFFNLLIYFNCIDFISFNLQFSRTCCFRLIDFLVVLAPLKFNFFKSCHFFNNLRLSLFFTFFHIDNLFHFLFLYFLQRKAIYSIRWGSFRVKGAYTRKKIFFNFFSLGCFSSYLNIVFLFLSCVNSFFCFLERCLLKCSLLRCLFILIFVFYYCLYLLGFYGHIAFNLCKRFSFRFGSVSWSVAFNKFILLNWYKASSFLKYNRYKCSLFSQNILYCNLNYRFSFYFTFFKKKTSVFSHGSLQLYILKFFKLLLFVLNMFTCCFYLGFKFLKKIIFVASAFFFFILKVSLIFCRIFMFSGFFLFIYYRYILFYRSSFCVLNLFSKFIFNFYIYRLLFVRFLVKDILRKRWYFKRSPMMLTHCFSCRSFKHIFPDNWRFSYRNKANFVRFNYRNLHGSSRQFFCTHVLRYYFKFNIKLFSWFSPRKVTKFRYNYFFSKSFLYADVEYDYEEAKFIYLGDANFFVRRLQLRFNFFMTLIIRFYAHSSSLLKK